MKKSELRQLIKEEITVLLKESKIIDDLAYDAYFNSAEWIDEGEVPLDKLRDKPEAAIRKIIEKYYPNLIKNFSNDPGATSVLKNNKRLILDKVAKWFAGEED